MQGKYGNLDSLLISYGPCQTPTLGFCVDRHDLIQTFKPETYWQIDATVKTPETNVEIKLTWNRYRVLSSYGVTVIAELPNCDIVVV